MKRVCILALLSVILYNCECQKSEVLKKDLNYFLNNRAFVVDPSPKNISINIKNAMERYNALETVLSNNPSQRDTLLPMFWDLCGKYFDLLSLKDTQQEPIIDSIQKTLFTASKTLTENQKFINSLLKVEENTRLITIDKPISPIFNLKKDSISIYNASNSSKGDEFLLEDSHFVMDLRKKALSIHQNFSSSKIIDSIYPNKKQLYLYSTSKTYTSVVESFGKEVNECFEYFYYNLKTDIKTLKEDAFLFASPYKLELQYYKNTTIDALINTTNATFCFDCPSDWDSQQVFAKLKGFENLYFSYSKKENTSIDDLNTPMRALYYVKDDLVFILWSDEIDLFGCSCL
jgi:hypothetical protein